VSRQVSRRSILAAGAGGLVGLAGCVASDDDASAGDEDNASAGDDATPGDDSTVTDGGDSNVTDRGDDDDLDLREANVTRVQTAFFNDQGEHRFDVTLYHDDDGEEGYADWWQVETLAGERLVRRDLTHAHGTEPFTRSARVTVPADVECVVVRGHDQTHGYGGQAMLVSLPGPVERHRQGPEPQSFEDASCP